MAVEEVAAGSANSQDTTRLKRAVEKRLAGQEVERFAIVGPDGQSVVFGGSESF